MESIYLWMVFTKAFSQKHLLLIGRFVEGTEYFCLCTAASYALCIIAYLTCALNYPLIDQKLNLMDRAMGFDWLKFFHFCWTQPIHIILKIAYDSLFSQLAFFAAWFSFFSRKDRLYEIFWIFIITLIATSLLSGFFPASGPASALGVEALYNNNFKQIFLDMSLIRAGINPDFSTHGMGGIVTFPSFHTVSAIIFMYGFRKSGLIGRIIFMLNIVMLLSIPAGGDHYLMDMLAGAAGAISSIAVVRFINSRSLSNVALYDFFLKPAIRLVRATEGKEARAQINIIKQ